MSLSMYLFLRFAPKSVVAEINRNCPKSYETGTKNTILGTTEMIRFLGRGTDVNLTYILGQMKASVKRARPARAGIW